VAGIVSGAAVETVTGPVPIDHLGIVAPHEHVFIDFTARVPSTGHDAESDPLTLGNLAHVRADPLSSVDNMHLSDLDTATDEVAEFGRLGGGTIVELTVPEVGRRVDLLRRVSESTGVRIVAGCGHFTANLHPAELHDEAVKDVAARLLRELTEGIDGTGIRAGVIGEIGTSHPIADTERKVIAASALAQRATGAPIILHLDRASRNGHDVLDALEEEGADLDGVVLSHLDSTLGHIDLDLDRVLDYHRSLADRGAYLGYDTCGLEGPLTLGANWVWLPSDRERAVAVGRLLASGHDRIVLSHDIAMKYLLRRYGGFGYGHILRTFTRLLSVVGVDDDDIDLLLRENPARMLTPRVRQGAGDVEA
jgi:phosphotriesterase-related protein